MSRNEKRGPSALEAWARQKTDGYDGVTIRNMTTSWRNGLAFCALIHRFRPDLIEFEKLDPCDILGNCSLAFEVAERQLGIPALLDPEDMAAHEVPDRLSVLTYVAQFYNTFKSLEKKSVVNSRLSITSDENVIKPRPGDITSKPNNPEKVILKRSLDYTEDEIMNEARKRVPPKSVMLSSATVCCQCQNPVFISERILFAKKLYHRSCFRCFNCNHILNPHTAEISPDGLLFCLENACHVELRRRSRESCISVFNDGSKNNSNTSVNSDKTNDEVVEGNQTFQDEVVPNFKSVTNVSPSLRRRSSTPSPQQDSLQTNPPPQIGDQPSVPPDSKLVETHVSVKDRVAALRSKFLDECQSDEPIRRSRPSSTSSASSDHDSRFEKTPSRSRSRSRSRSPGQISMGREPSDVLVLPPGSSFAAIVAARGQFPKTEKMDETDEGISSLENKGGDCALKGNLHLAPEDTNISEKIPIGLTVVERLVLNAEETNNKAELENVTAPVPIPLSVPIPVPAIDDSPPQSRKLSNCSPIGLRFKEDSSTDDVVKTRDGDPLEPPINVTHQITVDESKDSDSDGVGDKLVGRMDDKPLPLEAPIVNVPSVTEKSSSEILEESQLETPLHESEDTKALSQPENSKSFFDPENSKLLPSPKPEEIQLKVTPTPSPSPSPRKRVAPRPPKPAERVASTSQTKEIWKKKNYYPAELNPFESEEQLPIEPKNPFEEDDDEAEKVEDVPKPSPRSRRGTGNSKSVNDSNQIRSRSKSPVSVINAPPSPKPRTHVRTSAIVEQPKPFNPFEDEDDEEDESGISMRAGDETSSTCSRLSDGSSFNSNVSGTPIPKPRDKDSAMHPKAYDANSMRLKSRKTKKAPLPPSFVTPERPEKVSNPFESTGLSSPPKSPKSILKHSRASSNEIPSLDLKEAERAGAPSPIPKKIIPASPKLLKGLKNHTNQAAAQQYKKKRRAPPPRRRVEPLPEASIKTELEDLGIQERELERQGITLESTIRRLMDEESNNDQVDEMMVQLWNIINEKNDILRRQTELEYLRRGHRLEEMQAELEFQLRVLMDTPMNQRQDDHTHVENTLLEEMLKLVDERNEVVEWLDFHRKQDREEASRVSQSLTTFSSRKSDSLEGSQKEIILSSLPRKSSKKSKTKDKAKDKDKEKDKQSSKEKKTANKDKEEKKNKFGTLFGRKKNKGKKDKFDEDKDVDESLSTNSR